MDALELSPTSSRTKRCFSELVGGENDVESDWDSSSETFNSHHSEWNEASTTNKTNSKIRECFVDVNHEHRLWEEQTDKFLQSFVKLSEQVIEAKVRSNHQLLEALQAIWNFKLRLVAGLNDLETKLYEKVKGEERKRRISRRKKRKFPNKSKQGESSSFSSHSTERRSDADMAARSKNEELEHFTIENFPTGSSIQREAESEDRVREDHSSVSMTMSVQEAQAERQDEPRNDESTQNRTIENTAALGSIQHEAAVKDNANEDHDCVPATRDVRDAQTEGQNEPRNGEGSKKHTVQNSAPASNIQHETEVKDNAKEDHVSASMTMGVQEAQAERQDEPRNDESTQNRTIEITAALGSIQHKAAVKDNANEDHDCAPVTRDVRDAQTEGQNEPRNGEGSKKHTVQNSASAINFQQKAKANEGLESSFSETASEPRTVFTDRKPPVAAQHASADIQGTQSGTGVPGRLIRASGGKSTAPQVAKRAEEKRWPNRNARSFLKDLVEKCDPPTDQSFAARGTKVVSGSAVSQRQPNDTAQACGQRLEGRNPVPSRRNRNKTYVAPSSGARHRKESSPAIVRGQTSVNRPDQVTDMDVSLGKLNNCQFTQETSGFLSWLPTTGSPSKDNHESVDLVFSDTSSRRPNSRVFEAIHPDYQAPRKPSARRLTSKKAAVGVQGVVNLGPKDGDRFRPESSRIKVRHSYGRPRDVLDKYRLLQKFRLGYFGTSNFFGTVNGTITQIVLTAKVNYFIRFRGESQRIDIIADRAKDGEHLAKTKGPVAIFYDPNGKEQEGYIHYIGHYKVDHESGIRRNTYVYRGIKRCMSMNLKFDRYDTDLDLAMRNGAVEEL